MNVTFDFISGEQFKFVKLLNFENYWLRGRTTRARIFLWLKMNKVKLVESEQFTENSADTEELNDRNQLR